jgi:hypothetical protein
LRPIASLNDIGIRTSFVPSHASATNSSEASSAQLVEHALRFVWSAGPIPAWGLITATSFCARPNFASPSEPLTTARSRGCRAPRPQPATALCGDQPRRVGRGASKPRTIAATSRPRARKNAHRGARTHDHDHEVGARSCAACIWRPRRHL